MKKTALALRIDFLLLTIIIVLLFGFLASAEEDMGQQEVSLSQENYLVSDLTLYEPTDGVYFLQNEYSRRFAYPSSNTTNGANILQYDLYYNNRIPFSRKWEIKKQSDGYYTIQNVTSQKYLGFSTTESLSSQPHVKNYTAVSDNTKWKFYQTVHEAIILIPKGTVYENGPYVLSVSSGSYQNNTTLRLRAYTDDTDLQDEWSILAVDAADSFASTIKNDSTSRYIQAAGTISDTQVESASTVTDNTCLWMFEFYGKLNGEPYYHIKNKESNLYLASPANFSESTAIEQEDYLPNSQRQLWRLRRSGEVYYIESRYQVYNNTSLHIALNSSNKLIQTTSETKATWHPRVLSCIMNLYFDNSFEERHGSYLEKFNAMFSTPDTTSPEKKSFFTAMKQYFGVQTILTYASSSENYYESYPYTQNCNLIGDLNALCNNSHISSYNCSSSPNATTINQNCSNNLHHKSSLTMYRQIPDSTIIQTNGIFALFSGFNTCSMHDGNHYETIVGWGRNDMAKIGIFRTRTEDNIFAETVFHELMHCFGGSHHYESGTSRTCIYGIESGNVVDDLLLCENCYAVTHRNIFKLVNNNK